MCVSAESQDPNDTTVKYIFNVYPSDQPEDGIYVGGDDTLYRGVGRESFVINFCAFLILQHLIPEMKAHVFYKLALAVGGKYKCAVFPSVDYGPVERTHEESVQWKRIGEIGDDDDEEGSGEIDDFEGEKWWLRLLTQEGKSDEEILKDAWMGRGNMWVFKHPGLFPIEEAVEMNRQRQPLRLLQPVTVESGGLGVSKSSALLALPLELTEMILCHLAPEDALHFVCSAKVLYGQFHARLDGIVCAWIQRERPWYLSVGPIECEGGDEEVEYWKEGWAQTIELDGVDYEKEIPWFAYYLACKKSPNMRSRERIWKIVLQIKDTLEDVGVDL